LIPAFLLKENIEDLADFDPRAFVLLALVAACVSLLLLSIDSAIRRATRTAYFSRVVEYFCFFVILTGFVIPASESSGMKDPSRVGIDTVNVAVASLLALAMLLLSKSRFRRQLYTVILIFVALNAAMTIPAIHSLSRAARSAKKSIFRISTDKIIIVLSFDGVSGSAVREVLEENPELEEKFRGFVFYDRVASSSPATAASTAASLYGNRNFKESADRAKDLWGSAPHWLLTNNLNDNGYTVSTHDIYNREFRDRSRRHTRLAARPPASVLMLVDYSLARALTRVAVLPGDVAERLERRVERVLSPHSEDMARLRGQMSSAHSPRWKRRLLRTVLDFREYLRRMHVAGASPTAHFLHFTYSHFPVEFDRDCRFMGHDRDWFEARQDWNGVKEETYCVLTQASHFIETLKALDAFERALLVLKSDHGKPVKYGKPGSIEALPIRGHTGWGYGRYRPFLALKGFGPGREDVKHDEHPVLLDDLAKTVCLHSGVDVNCSAYTGYDLLGDDFAGIESSKVTVFVVASKRSGYRYDSHEAITIRRQADVVESLFAALTCEDSEDDCESGKR
jgi:hypothetical protein